MNLLKTIKSYMSGNTAADNCTYVVKDSLTGEVFLKTRDEEKAYRIALGKVRSDLVAQDKKKRWRSLANFDRDMICTGAKSMYMQVKDTPGITLPLVIEQMHAHSPS